MIKVRPLKSFPYKYIICMPELINLQFLNVFFFILNVTILIIYTTIPLVRFSLENRGYTIVTMVRNCG